MLYVAPFHIEVQGEITARLSGGPDLCEYVFTAVNDSGICLACLQVGIAGSP